MAYIEWTNELSVGVNEIDKQHQKLIDLINQLHESKDKEIDKITLNKVFEALVAYTKIHFTFEEKMLLEKAYPDLDDHKNTHKIFVDQLNVFMRQFKNNDDKQVSFSLLAFLKSWISKHIMVNDKEYGNYLKKKSVKPLQTN